ncbi:hypothetical protein PQR02_15440 [Paraburkholderia sediminicola]|uniref:Uncharacterized protein n=1 Tax=Paraburkholderia rhynchosiae TaxID=487049 RepID=A0ACC7NLG3_9BURK
MKIDICERRFPNNPEFHYRYWVNPYAQHVSSIVPDEVVCIDEHANVYLGTAPVNAAAAIHCGIVARYALGPLPTLGNKADVGVV